MSFLWKLCKPKKTEYVPLCPHDVEGVPLIPLLHPKIRKRILLSWCKIQDNGLLFVGNTMFKVINTTEDNQAMSRDKLEKASECFGCLVSEEHYMLIHPLQDKCYVVTKSIDRLVHLILCSSCMKDKVEELNVCNGINKKNYDMLKNVTIWIHEIILDDGFHPSMRNAWDEFFGCLKGMLDDSEQACLAKE